MLTLFRVFAVVVAIGVVALISIAELPGLLAVLVAASAGVALALIRAGMDRKP
ncbi:hypothetical protein GGQ87_000051 [Brevundimonas alba]|uniref:Uncharacterized protein n=1 Tax=Brevundimonas alba TaxID=74314 RepID=A0A7X5YHE9_9CAUL|nr:hypothetical protein [Brevundimonas alba]NJC39793.1 hypothetical protein [Brevundimonas alba]